MPNHKAFQSECIEETLIVMPAGSVSSLAGEEVSSELDGLLDQLHQPGPKNVVIDFAKVAYFGTVMLGALRVIWRRVDDREGKMALCNLSEMGREILRVSGFDLLWPICASREEALREIGG